MDELCMIEEKSAVMQMDSSSFMRKRNRHDDLKIYSLETDGKFFYETIFPMLKNKISSLSIDELNKYRVTSIDLDENETETCDSTEMLNYSQENKAVLFSPPVAQPSNSPQPGQMPTDLWLLRPAY